MLKKTALALAAATVLMAGCSNDNDLASVQFYATDGASIYTVNSTDSLNIEKKDLLGLNAGTLMYAIEVNPRGGTLNGIGSDGQSYLVNAQTGTLTPRGTPDSSNNLANKAVEIDYNPVIAGGNVYRVTASAGENYRVNDTTSAKAVGPSTAAPSTASTGSAGVAGNDLPFQYKAGDVNAGKTVVVSGIAYTNSQVNSGVPPATTVYAIDSQNNTLARLGGADPDTTARAAACPNATNPNCGQLTTIGALNEDVGTFVGFDIESVGTSGMAATRNTGYVTAFKGGTYNLYSIDLTTGALSFVTALNPKIFPARSIAIRQPGS